MSARPVIRCKCGQRILVRDVLQTGNYVRLDGPDYVFIKYRCSRCKHLGEQFIEKDRWNPSILREDPEDLTSSEKSQFDQMGPIAIDEQIKFHFYLEKVTTVKVQKTPKNNKRTVSQSTR